jgi:hypothetical protein
MVMKIELILEREDSEKMQKDNQKTAGKLLFDYCGGT